jgi:formylglycine-generating enzyme required for sulfatase activity
MRITMTAGLLAIAGALYAQTASRPPEVTKNAAGMEFVKIPTGEFMMGCSEGDELCKDAEKPAHRVRITKTIEFGKYEVTQAQFKAIMGEALHQSAILGDNLPVDNVTRAEAIQFANKLSESNDGYKYRLPTEAEWEYAARAGGKSATYGPLDEIAWWQKNSDDTTHPGGGKKANAWGIYDMIGNVREWTADTYLATYYANSAVDDPTGAPSNSGERGQPGYQGGAGVALPLIRGGGWDNPAQAQRVSDRYFYFGPTLRMGDLGFRVVREPVAR